MTARSWLLAMVACGVGMGLGTLLTAAASPGGFTSIVTSRANATRTTTTRAATAATAATRTTTRTSTAATRSTTRSTTTAAGGRRGPGTAPDDEFMEATVGEVTMDVSNHWDLNVGKPGMVLESLPPLDTDATGKFQASLVVRKGTVSKAPANMVALGTSEQSVAATQETGYRAVEAPAAVTIGGLQGVKFAGTFKRGGATVRCREYILRVGGTNQVYMIVFTCLNSKWAGYQAQVERYAESFTLKK